ncbi:MAG: hypothetical protein K0R71_1992 [Bacillales bacterium]|jgi:hypothetical protein|nr:hypothetical protein [Bacillales bacterium]
MIGIKKGKQKHDRNEVKKRGNTNSCLYSSLVLKGISKKGKKQ